MVQVTDATRDEIIANFRERIQTSKHTKLRKVELEELIGCSSIERHRNQGFGEMN